MRKQTTTLYEMQYPNKTHFAFVPAIIKLTAVRDLNRVAVTVKSTTTDRTFSETREVHNGEVYFDIQRALQMCFEGVEKAHIDYGTPFTDSALKHTVQVNTTATASDGTSVFADFKIDALWGGVRTGESSGGELRRRWFVNYPFSVDVFTKFGDEFDITVNDGNSDGVIFYNQEPDATGATAYRRALLAPAQIFDVAPTTRKIHIALPHGIVLKDDNETIGITAYTLDIDHTEPSDRTIYLRWVDNQGRYNYYLFKKLGESSEYSTTAWLHNEQNVPTAYVDGLNVASGLRQSFAESQSLTLGARLVDEATLSYLLTLQGSPIVDMFAGYDSDNQPLWRRVNVSPAKFERTTKPLQDFSTQIIIPTATLQQL